MTGWVGSGRDYERSASTLDRLCRQMRVVIMDDMRTVFDAVGGIDGLRRLANAWHRRVMADEVVAHAFSHGFHPQHIERLAAYWAEALGGPTMYSDSYGDEALADAGLAGDGALRQVLHDYFAWATTTTMSRYHQSADDVPKGLSIPRWSWDGLQL